MRFKYLSHHEPNGLGVQDVLTKSRLRGAYDAYVRCLTSRVREPRRAALISGCSAAGQAARRIREVDRRSRDDPAPWLCREVPRALLGNLH